MNKLRCIIIVNDYGYVEGGASNVAIETAIALSKYTQYKIYYLCAVGPICKELKDSNIEKCLYISETDCMHMKNHIHGVIFGLYNISFEKTLTDFLSKFNNIETLVHVHTWTKACSSVIFKVTAEKKFHTIVTLHDYFMSCPNGGFYNYKKQKICRKVPLSFKCITSNCDSRNYAFKLYRILRSIIQINNIESNYLHLIYISQFSKKKLKPYIESEKQIDSYFLHDPVSFPNWRNRVEAEKNTIFLYVGRLSEEKGIKLFCDAISKLNLKGCVIGDGNLLSDLKQKYPNIQFLGWMNHSNIEDYFKITRCLIFPSQWYETLGLTVLEANAVGLPCIVPDENASSDNIKDGINGLIFHTGSINSLINTIKKTLDNGLISSMSKESFNNFDKKKWNIETYTRKLVNIYKSIINHI